MPRYLTSDLHLGHENIIDHCNRPFTSIDEMNETLIDNWNSCVDERDVVFFLGDLGKFAGQDQLHHWLDQLNGRIVFIQGNHDKPERYTTGVNTHQYYILQNGNREFCLTHSPENAPKYWNDWIIHGHHHNNDLENYPLLHPENKTVNISIELTNYKPIEESQLLELLDRNQKITEVSKP